MASDKREAIARVNSHIGRKSLNHRNTHFSNVNKVVPVWWLEIPVTKVGKQLHLLLRRVDGSLIWLRCPSRTLEGDSFRCRPEKDAISLEIRVGDFRERRSGHDFSRYVELQLPAR